MLITLRDQWNCLQSPEREAMWEMLNWISVNGFNGIPRAMIAEYFNEETSAGLKRLTAWLDQNSIISWVCPDEEGDPQECFIVASPSSWSAWNAAFVAGELSFLATCTIPLFP